LQVLSGLMKLVWEKEIQVKPQRSVTNVASTISSGAGGNSEGNNGAGVEPEV
jgi:hypothetical protein